VRIQWWIRPGPSPDVLELDLGVAVRSVVITEHAEHAHDVDARRLARHEDHRLLQVARRLRVGLAHEDEDLAARVARTGRPPLAPVDDVVVAIALDPRADVGRIGRGDVRLGHAERGADLAFEQRLEPLLLLVGAGVANQRLHVAGVGGRAVGRLARERIVAHDLAQRRVLEIGQPGAVLALRQEHVPEPGGLGALLQLLHHRDRLPAIGRLFQLVGEHFFGRQTILAGELE
jgi:hypothetical protein